jgi:hypothetical protein
MHRLLAQPAREVSLARGRIQRCEFHESKELTPLPQKTVTNWTGYGAPGDKEYL